MYGNYLLGLREGLEAGLIVCILVAYLVRTERRDALRPVWIGVGVAVALSLGFGFALEYSSQELTSEAQEFLGGSLSILAVCLVTWTVFWALPMSMGTGALAATAFLAVGRKGLETALFFWASIRSATDENNSTQEPLIGVLLGIATAILLARLLYRGALRISPARFFAWTGGLLVVVAAGVLAYGVRALQEARFLDGSADKAFDISPTIPSDSWYGTLLQGVFSFHPNPTVLQVTVWALYLVPALGLFLAPVGFGRSVGVGVKEQKAADEKAGSGWGPGPGSEQAGSGGDGARRDDGAVPDGERVHDGARGAGSRTGGNEV